MGGEGWGVWTVWLIKNGFGGVVVSKHGSEGGVCALSVKEVSSA